MMGRSRLLAAVCAGWLALSSAQAIAACNPNKTAPPVADRYLIDGATVKDKLTGLIWQRCSLGQTWKPKIGCVGLVAQVNFAEAQDEAGAEGWRLPRPAELRSLTIGRCKNPSITEAAFPDMDPAFQWYWAYDGKLDQVVNFGDGNPGFCDSPKCAGNAVRLVRGEADEAALAAANAAAAAMSSGMNAALPTTQTEEPQGLDPALKQPDK